MSFDNINFRIFKDLYPTTIDKYFKAENYIYGFEYFIEFIHFMDKELYLINLLNEATPFSDIMKLLPFFDKSTFYRCVSSSKYITIDFIDNNINDISWKHLTCNITLNHNTINQQIIYKYSKQLDMNAICSNAWLDEKLIDDNIDLIPFKSLSENGQTFSDKFYDKYHDKLDWNLIVKHSQLKEDILLKYIFKMSLADIIKYQCITEKFIEKYDRRFSWSELIYYNIVREDVLLKYIHRLNKKCIQNILIRNVYCGYTTLFDKIGWDNILNNFATSFLFKTTNADKILSIQKKNNII